MQPRSVLLVSPRKLERAVWRCLQAEFEEVLGQVEDVERIEITQAARGNGWVVRQLRRVARRLAHTELQVEPALLPIELTRDYDLFCFYAAQPHDLRLLDLVPAWRKRSALAVCIMEELWTCDLDSHWLSRLARFDLTTAMFYDTVEPLARHTGLRCLWSPPAVDVLRFCPGRTPPPRSIDLYYMGRRSQAAHRALLSAAKERGFTYLFDSIAPVEVRDSLLEHRDHLAEMLKRTRYFVANKGKVDEPSHRGTQEELGARSFEGAAAGAVLLGDTPRSPSVKLLFDWPDAHIEVPFHATDIAEVMAALDEQPERLERIRRDNLVNCLRRHDFAHRWTRVLEALALPRHPALDERLRRLEELARSLEESQPKARALQQSG